MVSIKADAVALAEAKAEYGNKSRVIHLSGGAEVFVKEGGSGKAGSGGRIVIRGQHVKPSHKLGAKARAMKACAGKRGCDFKSCLEAGGITSPRSVRKSCG